VYLDKEADIQKAVKIAVDSKVKREKKKTDIARYS